MKLLSNLAVLFILSIAFSCSKVNTDGDPGTTPPKDKSVTGGQIDEALPKNIYPHTAIPDFNKKHGVFYNKGASCTKCHGQDLTGGIAKKDGKQVSCNDCHQSFPHTKDFKESFKHGSEYLKSQKSESKLPSGECLSCHKDNRVKDGEEIVRKQMKSCQDCHSFPHNEAKWVKEGHGTSFQDEGVESCASCHTKGSDFAERNPEDFSSCLDCHNDDRRKGVNPHKPGYMKRKNHGYDKDRLGMESCTICHDNSEQAKSCNKCHKSYPHNTIKDMDEDEFFEGMHGEMYNEKPKNCQDCHANEDSQIEVENSCMDCHDSLDMAPASHDRSENFISRQNHGYQYMDNSKDCTICHKPEIERENKTCSKCHGREVAMPHSPHFSLGDGNEAGSHGYNWKLYCRDGVNNLQPTCKNCHGNPISKVSTSCLDCHDADPMTDETLCGPSHIEPGKKWPWKVY